MVFVISLICFWPSASGIESVETRDGNKKRSVESIPVATQRKPKTKGKRTLDQSGHSTLSDTSCPVSLELWSRIGRNIAGLFALPPPPQWERERTGRKRPGRALGLLNASLRRSLVIASLLFFRFHYVSLLLLLLFIVISHLPPLRSLLLFLFYIYIHLFMLSGAIKRDEPRSRSSFTGRGEMRQRREGGQGRQQSLVDTPRALLFDETQRDGSQTSLPYSTRWNMCRRPLAANGDGWRSAGREIGPWKERELEKERRKMSHIVIISFWPTLNIYILHRLHLFLPIQPLLLAARNTHTHTERV